MGRQETTSQRRANKAVQMPHYVNLLGDMSSRLEIDKSQQSLHQSTMATYSSKRLSTTRSVRMLSLEEELDDGTPTVSCCLVEVSLNDPNLHYQALSYVWGSAKPTSDIFVNGGKLGVTRNLEKVLRQLRTNKFYCSDRQCDCFQKPDSPVPLNYHFTFPSFLWIDAICIDQDNKEERAQQVTLMREIYRRASQVLVWLGPATEQTVPAFRLLFGLAELNE